MATRSAGARHGWDYVSETRKREIVAAIAAGRPTSGPVHAELDLTDRCNVACYFCNQQDTRSKQQIPLARAVELIDELVAGGLASVRLSGGGDPLHHREILQILDHLAERGVVIDQLNTNGVSLGPAVAERLVSAGARELHISLNTVDGADYKRMMTVKAETFERVVENVRALVELRGERELPVVTIQYLLDRVNAGRVVEMYDLALEMGADRVAFGAVQPIPFERIEESVLLTETDAERLLPRFVELFERDREHGVADVLLMSRGLDQMVWEARSRAGVQPRFPTTAPSFAEKNAGCFFAWYSTTVTGNGNLYPCCLLIHPDTKPLGNIGQGSFQEQWRGADYQALRREMREVLLDGADKAHPPERYQHLKHLCLEPQLCWLKNGYFRHDESFYGELAAALDQKRARRASLTGARRTLQRVGERFPLLARGYHRARNGSRPARVWLKRALGLPLTRAV